MRPARRGTAALRGRPGPPAPRGAQAWLALALLAAAACTPRSIPERLRELPPDFKRFPYVQDVTSGSATVVWQTHSPETATLSYWTGDSINKFNVVDTTVSLDHAITLPQLRPDTEYSYEVQTWEGTFTERRTFRSAPRPGTRKAFKFLVFGDSGEGTQGQLQLADRMPGEKAALVIHVGDVAYDNGSEIDFDVRHFAVYKELMSSVPFYPALGNHDIRTDLGKPYLDAFRLPRDNPDETERYYSFQHDDVLFIALDSNTGPAYAQRFGDLRETGSAQYRWLRGELERARADKTVDWIVVYMHHPLFSSGRGIAGHGSDLPLRQALVPLFDRYGVDVVFTGHDHDYERSFPIRCKPDAPVTQACLVKGEDPKKIEQGSGTVYLVTGAGGGPFAWRAVGVNWWTAFARQVYEYLSVEVDPEFMLIRCVDAGGAVLDEVRIEKPGAAGRPVPGQEEKPAPIPGQPGGGEERGPERPAPEPPGAGGVR